LTKYTVRYILSSMTKAERTRLQIISTASELFNWKGFQATSISDIESAAGLSKGALYANFKTKNDLMVEAFQFSVRLMLDDIMERVNAAQGAGEKLAAFLGYFSENYKKIFSRGGCPIANTAVEADDTDAVLRKKVSGVILSVRDMLVTIIRRGVETREFRNDIRPEQVADQLFSLVEGGALLAKATGKSDFLINAVQNATEVINTCR